MSLNLEARITEETNKWLRNIALQIVDYVESEGADFSDAIRTVEERLLQEDSFQCNMNYVLDQVYQTLKAPKNGNKDEV